MHKNKEIKRVVINLLPQYTTVEIIDGAGCRYTASVLPDISPSRGRSFRGEVSHFSTVENEVTRERLADLPP